MLAVSAGVSRNSDPRKRFFREFDVSVGFGVFEIDVVLRLMMFDERVFQKIGFFFGRSYDIFKRTDRSDELCSFCVMILFLKIRRDPFSQVFCLADIDDRSFAVFIQVAARRMGDIGKIEGGHFRQVNVWGGCIFNHYGCALFDLSAYGFS